MAKPLVVAFGEVLFDQFPDEQRLGGAPANFACHAAALGAEVHLVSAVGADELGDRALRSLRARGVNTDDVQRRAAHPTGTVTIELHDSGVPSFTIGADAAWDHVEWTDGIEELVSRCDAVYFGTLGQRSATSRATVRRFVRAARARAGAPAMAIIDLNVRAPHCDERMLRDSLGIADVVKLSHEEWFVVAAACGLDSTGARGTEELRERGAFRCVALTLGSRGAILTTGEKADEHPGISVEVRDTVGAGDAFAAALTLGLLRGDSLADINRLGCRAAAFVCTKDGGAPDLAHFSR